MYLLQDFRRRELQPDLPWGPSFKQQLEDAQVEEEYRELLRDLRILYKHEKPDVELQILAFIRRDRYTEQLTFVVGVVDTKQEYSWSLWKPRLQLQWLWDDMTADNITIA